MTSGRDRSGPETDRWFTNFNPDKNASVRLFCFPYAGAGAMVYRRWRPALPPGVEGLAAQLPGREIRLKEKPYTNLLALVEALAGAIDRYLDKPFAFFGHSMGALTSFELAHLLRERCGVEPLHFFVSGCSAPHMRENGPLIYNLPDDKLVEELRRLNGTPQEVLEHAELLPLMLPLLRADFEVCDTYVYSEKRPLHCPMTVFGGFEDPDVTEQRLKGWREHTAGTFSLELLPGDHFFLHTADKTLHARIRRELSNSLGALSVRQSLRTSNVL